MKSLPFLLSLFLGFNCLFAQNQDILLTIANTKVPAEEFKATYLKNSAHALSGESLDDYLQLFINFKLKVQEARQQKIDTSQAFIAEYEEYVKQLAQPYLTDAEVNDNLIDEAYSRLNKEIKASHILISIPDGDDTLKYYKKAIEVRNRIIGGEDFEKVAVETSSDPSVSKNRGSLGYFTAFQMVYPFETAAYNTRKGEVSMPVRTRFGYHLVKVFDIRPSQGKVKIAHIMIKTAHGGGQRNIDEAHKKIMDIHARLIKGEDFATIAKNESQDENTSQRGGEFPWLSAGQIIPEIDAVAFALSSDGAISEPVQTPFGWHIIKRLGRNMVGTKEEMTPEIKTKISRDMRSAKSKESFVAKLKVQYGFKENKDAINQVKSAVDSAVYASKWEAPVFTKDAVVFTLAGNEHRSSEFANYIAEHQYMARNSALSTFLNTMYSDWVSQVIIGYEESQLPVKYPEFRHIAQEYLEGMLLFEITDRTVWKKSYDSTALADFYSKNIHNYKWGERVHYAVYTLPNALSLDKFKKMLLSGKTSTMQPGALAQTAGKKLKIEIAHEQKSANTDSPEIKDYKQWKDGIKEMPSADGHVVVLRYIKTTTGDTKLLADCRGEVTADLQVEMEKQWIAKLKENYPVTLNTDVYKRLSDELNK